MTTAREQAMQLHEQFQRSTETVRARNDLSDLGKAQILAIAYQPYRDQLAKLADDNASRLAMDITRAQRAAFGVPTDPIEAMSYRDAMGRAEAIDDPQIAHAKIVNAIAIGDIHQAKALAAEGVERGWNNVVNTWTDANPEAGRNLANLQQAQARVNNPNERLIDGMSFAAHKPDELSRYQDYQIDSIVAESHPAGVA